MRWLLFISFFLGASAFWAQQIPQFSQWYWNLQAINPAHTGIKPCLEIKSLYRSQWAGLDGSPNSGFATFSTPIYTERKKIFTPRQGVGFKMETEKIGPFTMNRLNLMYAGHFNFTPDTRLSIGIAAGIRQWVFDKTKVSTLAPDPAIPESNSFISPDASCGFWWNGKNYFVGLSFMELTSSKWTDIGDKSRFRFHTFLNGGYHIPINDQFTLLPFALLRIPPKGPASLDLNALFDYKNRITFGIGFRNTDAILTSIKVRINGNFTLAYSFDYTISDLARNDFFSHEFSLGFGTCKDKSNSKTTCPLF